MKDFLRDDLIYKEIPSKPQEKDPYHHHSWDFAYFCRYGHQYLTYLPWEFMSKLFFQKKCGSEIPYLPAVWTSVQIFVVCFFAGFPHYLNPRQQPNQELGSMYHVVGMINKLKLNDALPAYFKLYHDVPSSISLYKGIPMYTNLCNGIQKLI